MTIRLLSAPTPNGIPISILLEELKAIGAAGVDYALEKINILKNVQKEPWFIELNPNGRIPVIVDQGRNNFVVHESSAILLYLTAHYDKSHQFSYHPINDADNYSELLQWLFFAHGGIGPMQGQANHFIRYAPEDVPYGKKRYSEETKRLYGVLQLRLQNRDYLTGPGRGKYTVADLKTYAWVRNYSVVAETLDEWPAVKAWIERIDARPASTIGRESYA